MNLVECDGFSKAEAPARATYGLCIDFGFRDPARDPEYPGRDHIRPCLPKDLIGHRRAAQINFSAQPIGPIQPESRIAGLHHANGEAARAGRAGRCLGRQSAWMGSVDRALTMQAAAAKAAAVQAMRLPVRSWVVLAGVGMVLAACAHKAPPPAPQPPPPSTGEGKYDLLGESSQCQPPHIINVPAGVAQNLTLTFGNDGGWCALRLSRNGKPFDAGLLPVLPKNGVVFIHKVAGFTRIDYTPNAGFFGTDAFTVKLLPGYLPVHVAVTILALPATQKTAPSPQAAPPQAKPPAAGAKR